MERRTTASVRTGPAMGTTVSRALRTTLCVAMLFEAMARLTVFTTEPCSFCRNAKALLEKRGVDYEEVNLAKDPVGRAELVKRTGLMTFPQIVVDGEPLGGFRELIAADESG